MRNLNKIFLLLTFVFFTVFAFAQTTVSGTVTGDGGDAIPGATVLVKGTTVGTVADMNGKYTITAPEGSQFLVFSYIGMETKELAISGGTLNVQLSIESSEIAEIYIIADRAKERETPVAFSNIEKEEIEQQLGSRDLPLVMNSTPSVYSTVGGGGAGDARINVRGFNQRNVAIMINGVPINDMENGWVYWSNWDGISDATSSIQMQRGLSAVNLATPSIGGTMNVITSPAEKEAGFVSRLEYGSGNFMKATLTGHTGLINDKYAVSGSIVRKVGSGVIDGTWTDAWAYYLGSTYKINKSHKLELFAIGAPQRHGQNLYKQNIAAYNQDYAAELGYSQDALDAYPESVNGRLYNENYSAVSSSYDAQQSWKMFGSEGKLHNRYDSENLNERENYFHKPIVNMNWYATWTDKIKQYTTLYYSGGNGGGTGTLGSMRWNYHDGQESPSRYVWYDGTIAQNTATDTAYGILRNSINKQWTVGAISKFKIIINDNLKAQVGVDWRTAEIEHAREVRDLLGGQFYIDNNNEFNTDPKRYLGDKIAYYSHNTVDWIGYFAQAEYSTEAITAYATLGQSFTKYHHTNHFKMGDDGNELQAESEALPGFQIKGGVSYRPMKNLSVFGNYGYVSKSPIFDNVINDGDGSVTEDPSNEIFKAFEFGTSYQSTDKKLNVSVNYYNTLWENRALALAIVDLDGSEKFFYIQGMDQKHTGFELEANYKPIDFVDIGIFGSLGDWNYLNDVVGTYKDYDGGETDEEYSFYTAGLKVGDAPQTQFGTMITFFPVDGLRVQFDARYNTNYYADWDPFSRTDETDTDQVWLTPAFTLVDAHFSYDLPLKGKVGVQVFGHVFNLLDEVYIQDAVDNSRYNGFNDDGIHDASSAEVFLGLPRTFNVGLKLTF